MGLIIFICVINFLCVIISYDSNVVIVFKFNVELLMIVLIFEKICKCVYI